MTEYLEQGRGDPPLVFLHGIGGGAVVWASQLAALSPRVRCIAWNAPGYGGRPLPDAGLSWDGLADDLAGLLDRLGVERIVPVGHSMGGMTAQAFARRHPDRLAALVLSGTSASFGNPEGDWQQRFLAERLRPLDEGRTMADLAPKLVASMVSDDPEPAGVEAAVAAMSAVPDATYRAALSLLVTFEGRSDLARIAVPTLVLAGEADRNAPPETMARMATKIPGARYLSLEGAGHLANLERPEAFNKALADFLDTLRR